jgi:hypothetical protein
VTARQRARRDADARARNVAHDARTVFEQYRLRTAQITLHVACDRELSATDAAAHAAGRTDAHVSRHVHVAFDATQNLERAIAAHVTADDSTRADH